MPKSISTFFLVLATSVGMVFTFPTSSAQTVVNTTAQSSVGHEAARLHSTLAPLTMHERRAVFSGLTSQMKSELWKAHFRSYLSKPDITDAQKDAIQSALAWVEPRLYDIPKDSLEFEESVNKPLQRLEQRFKEVFPRELAREILYLLGGPEPKMQAGATVTSPVQVTKVSSLVGDKKAPAAKSKPCNMAGVSCGCTTRSDWCPEWYDCHNEGCSPHCCCGTMFFYMCDGECHAALPPQ